MRLSSNTNFRVKARVAIENVKLAAKNIVGIETKTLVVDPGFGRPSYEVLARAPNLPVKRADGALTEILPPFGTNPPTGPVPPTAPDLGERYVHNDPRELWYLALPNKLSPRQVLQILRAALGGDIWQQWQLLSLMLDTWPMLRKCAHEVRQAVASCKFVVRPYAEEGAEPTAQALDKAATVRRAMHSFRPDPFTDEAEFSGMVYDITEALLNGLCMVELMWARQKDGVLLPRASAWVHPRHFTFGNDGRLAIFDEMYNRFNFKLANRPGPVPDTNKFMCPQFKTRSGSSLGAGLIRPLAWDWSAVVFNKEWMLQFAQKYGNPFLDASYKPGLADTELRRLEQFMENAGAQGFCLHPDGSVLQVHPAQSLGPDNAQRAMMEMADEHCATLMLGQSSTSKATPGKLGNEDSKDKVKREVVQGVAKMTATVLTSQFAAAVCRVNFGDDAECPTVEADFTEESDPQAEAARDQVFLTNKVPMVADEFYTRHNLKMPQPDDVVIVGGQLGTMSDYNEQEVGAPQLPPDMGDQEQGVVDEAGGPDNLQAVLAVSAQEDFDELKELVAKARASGHVNGEWDAVKVKIKHLKETARV